MVFGETEPVTEGEDTAVKDGHQKISPCCIITAKSRDQRQGDDVDDIDGDHGTDGAGGVDFRTLLDVLGQGAAERTIRDVHASIAQNQYTVSNVHIQALGTV